jgi:hypothetical protein
MSSLLVAIYLIFGESSVPVVLLCSSSLSVHVSSSDRCEEFASYHCFWDSLTAANVDSGSVDLLAACKVPVLLEIRLLRLFTSWTVDSTEALFTAPLCPALHSPLGRPSVHSVLPRTFREEHYKAASHVDLYRFVLFSALFTIEVHSELSPGIAVVHPARF